MTDLIAGIDPDGFGAIVLVEREGGALVEVRDMPQLEGSAGGRLVDLNGLALFIDLWSPRIGEAFIEKAWARPTDPPSFAFRVGHNYGGLCGLLRAHFVRLHIVSPQRWKKAMGVSSDKDLSRHAAADLWPREGERFRFKKNHGRAEAALIAAYGRRETLKESGRGA